MRILITNTWLVQPGGTEGGVRDLALHWHRRGDHVMIFSPRLGAISEPLARAGIEVTDDLTTLSAEPDLIHGQHQMETMMAVQYFKNAPALFYCNGYQPWQEAPPVHPRILLYVTISELTTQYVHEKTGVPAGDILRISNYADHQIFKPRSDADTDRIRRAVIYDRYLSPAENAAIINACTAAGISCDTFVDLNPPVQHPEKMLTDYDLVFAVGKSAIEAMSCGCAVIQCTGGAMGELVTTENLTFSQSRNFTAIVDQIPVTAERVRREISRYSPADVRAVTRYMHTDVSLERYIKNVDLAHAELLRRAQRTGAVDSRLERAAEFRHAMVADQLIHRFVKESSQHQHRVHEMETKNLQSESERELMARERDHARDQVTAIQNTTVWRMRETMMSIPRVGTLLDRLGKMLAARRAK